MGMLGMYIKLSYHSAFEAGSGTPLGESMKPEIDAEVLFPTKTSITHTTTQYLKHVVLYTKVAHSNALRSFLLCLSVYDLKRRY
jgi:hypothetical protein